MGHGGKREGAGRKPKADEIKTIESMDKAMIPDEAWEALAKKVKDGDVPAIKLWLAYRFGQPKKTIDHQNNGGRFERLEVVYVESE